MTADRFNTDKLRMDLVAPSILTAIARVSAMGAVKYGERNWEKGFQYKNVYSSLMRHLAAWWQGEDKDAESGLSHLDHIAWNIHVLVEHERRVAEGSLPSSADDRPKNVVQGYGNPSLPPAQQLLVKLPRVPTEEEFNQVHAALDKIFTLGGYRQGGDPPILLGENV